jgi:hypothetical protein
MRKKVGNVRNFLPFFYDIYKKQTERRGGNKKIESVGAGGETRTGKSRAKKSRK